MMSEKQFERWNDHSCKVKDNQENTFLNWEDVVNKLNEQQAEIERITEILNIKQMRLESLMKHREEIGKLLNRIDEQQTTIDRQAETIANIQKSINKCYNEECDSDE